MQPSFPVRLAISWLTNALVLAAVAGLLSGVHVRSTGALLAAAAVFGILNTFLKPVLRFVTLPAAVLTLGFAWLLVSMLMLALTRDIVPGFQLRGFGTFLEAAVIVWLVNVALDFTPGPWQLTGKRRGRHRRQIRSE